MEKILSSWDNKLTIARIAKRRHVIPKSRIPSHPGEVLYDNFLVAKKISQVELARKINVSIQRINTLINGKRDMSPETAILLSRALGTTPEFWMNLQTTRDLAVAQHNMQKKGFA
jgi:antitoxin HigA-1